MGIEINEITTILGEDSFNETDITCQLFVWFDILIVFFTTKSSLRETYQQ